MFNLLELHNDRDEYLINYLNLRECKALICIANQEGQVITIDGMADYTGMSASNCLIATERLLQLGIISPHCHIDDFISMKPQNKQPVFSLNLNKVTSAIRAIRAEAK